MYSLFPAIKPYASYQLHVSDLHSIYVEESGNPAGIPILFVCGGPGLCSTSDDRRYFDPVKYRIILFDQRGNGKSKPFAEIKENNTNNLLSDIETIRKHLNINKWIICAHSWGTILALLYAQKYPKQVINLILVSICLGREVDINWVYLNGTNLVFPDYWMDFILHLNIEEKQDIVRSYHDILRSSDEITRMSMAKNWALWHARCMSLHFSSNIAQLYSNPHLAISFSIIATHYLTNKYFIKENQILHNLDKIEHIPTYLIHGRYDMLSPFSCAWKLKKMLKKSEIFIIRDAGHHITEHGIIDALILITNKLSYQLS